MTYILLVGAWRYSESFNDISFDLDIFEGNQNGSQHKMDYSDSEINF